LFEKSKKIQIPNAPSRKKLKKAQKGSKRLKKVLNPQNTHPFQYFFPHSIIYSTIVVFLYYNNKYTPPIII